MKAIHVLVTGGAGFIGSRLVDALLADGHRVTVVDNFDDFYDRRAKESNIAGHRRHARYALIEADIRNTRALNRAVSGHCDAIVHLAARAGVRASIADPVTCQDVNVRGTQNLLEFARQNGIRQFVFASSSSVYGVNPRVPWSEADHVLQPISPYASTKISGELLGHVYSHLYGIRFLALRFFSVYGPRQRPDLAIHAFVRRMMEGQPITVYGDGSTKRDYTFVDDIVDGIVQALEYDRSAYEVFNLGNNRTLTVLDLIAQLERALGVTARIEHCAEQPGDVPQTWANVEKAQHLLGYHPKTEYATGIKLFADWFLQSTSQRLPSPSTLPETAGCAGYETVL
jgi:UDP-glucuronate 4-epimerase